MCDPATAMMMASAGSSALEYQDDVTTYNNTVDANQRSRASAVDSAQLQIGQTRLREEQTQANILDQRMDNLIKGIETTESLKTATLEDGILGRSVQLALNDSVRDRLVNDTRMKTQSKYNSQQASMDAKGIDAQLQGRLASIVDPTPPNLAGAILKGGANALAAQQSVGTDTKWSDVFGTTPTATAEV